MVPPGKCLEKGVAHAADFNTSLKSNTSRSSLYNRQLLKQQKEPVDEDANQSSFREVNNKDLKKS